MPRSTATILLFLFGFNAFAQKVPRLLEKLGLKELQQKVEYIPPKTFSSLNYTGGDSVSLYRSRTSIVKGFYMSKTEVTNREYREFVHYVRDSIAHTHLSHFTGGTGKIDWNIKLDWEDARLESMMLGKDLTLSGRKEIDPNAVLYDVDLSGRKETISIYPDTLTWIRDYANTFNEPMAKNYFSHAFYDDYPVVGVSQKQATAFCQWKTIRISQSMNADAAAGTEVVIRLPTNYEWESAAMKGLDTVMYRKKDKHYLYNFGNIIEGNRITIKTYRDDGFFYTAPVKNFPEGPYGLFDMKGNVSEWTSTPMEEVMNAELRETKSKTIYVVKGGGWNSSPFYLQAGVCQFFPADITLSYIGFRYAVQIKDR